MKKFLLLFGLIIASSLMLSAQDYNRVTCPNCGGNGQVFSGYYDYYGYPIFMACPGCGGYGFILVPSNNNQNVSFKGSRLVTLKNANGRKLGTGTYYSVREEVVVDGDSYKVTDSNVSGFKYMVKFSKGYDNWYFN